MTWPAALRRERNHERPRPTIQLGQVRGAHAAPRPRRVTVALLEQVDSVESAGAQIAVFAQGFGAATVIVAGLDVD
jgi:hypothetical protein